MKTNISSLICNACIARIAIAIACRLGLATTALAVPVPPPSISFTSGTDPNADDNAGYAAVRFRNFSNAGGANGEVYIGNQSYLGTVPTTPATYAINNTAWSEQTYSFTYTYNPVADTASTTITPASGSPYTTSQSITVPAATANELQILDRNGGSGDLILNLSSINSVAGGTVSFSGATWDAANGAYLQSYLDSPTLFNQGFTLNGTITLDQPTSDYSNNEGSKIEIDLANVASVPDGGATVAMLGAALTGIVAVRRQLTVK